MNESCSAGALKGGAGVIGVPFGVSSAILWDWNQLKKIADVCMATRT